MKRKIIPYNPKLVALAKELRQNMTLGEVALWREINNNKLGVRFSRQIPIDNFIADFYCKGLQLAIEIDGSIHFEDGHEEKDALRQHKLESIGVKVVRFSDWDTRNNLSWVLRQIKNEITNLTTHP